MPLSAQTGNVAQIEGHRLTVMDVFYYLDRGHDFDYIRRAMPSLTHEQFDAVVAYVKEHYQQLLERDRRVDERVKQGKADQKARGLHPDIDPPWQREPRA